MGEVVVTPGSGTRPTVVALTGEWDAADIGLDQTLKAAVRDGNGRLVVDMLQVSFIDSSVVRACVAAHRVSQERSGWIRLVYTHHVIRRVIEICGLTEVLPQFASVEAALRGHERAGGEILAVEEGRAR